METSKTVNASMDRYALEKQLLKSILQPKIRGAVYRTETVERYARIIKQNLSHWYGATTPSVEQILRDDVYAAPRQPSNRRQNVETITEHGQPFAGTVLFPSSISVSLNSVPRFQLLGEYERAEWFEAVQTDTIQAFAQKVATEQFEMPENWPRRMDFVRRLATYVLSSETTENGAVVVFYMLRLTVNQKYDLQAAFPEVESV